MSRRSQESATPQLDARRRERELADVAWLLADPRGRRLMWRVFSIAGIFRNAFTGSSETFFNTGKQVIGTTLLKDLMETDPEAFAAMQREAVRQEQDDALAAEIELREANSDG